MGYGRYSAFSCTGTEYSRKNGGGIPSVPARTSGCGRIGRTGWELDTLVSALMTALPDHAASPLMTRLQDELRTESVRSQAREQFTGAVDRIFDTAESVCIASVARTVLRAVRDTVVSVARAVWNWIFF